MVMALCRPFFPQIIYHWHAAGLGEWLQTQAKGWERWLSRRLLARPALSIVISDYNRRDGEQLASQRIEVVPNGIPDPCPRFEEEVLPVRCARAVRRRGVAAGGSARAGDTGAPTRSPAVFQVLFLALCLREKGLFDSLEAVALANRQLAGVPVRVTLKVAGSFWHDSERAEFDRRIRQPDLSAPEPAVEYLGFVSGEAKARLLCESDCLCFPTYYVAESFGLVLAEAMAFGLPIVTTRWRMIPEILPVGYPGLVDPRSPEQVASRFLQLIAEDHDPSLRSHFLRHFTEERFARGFLAALRTLGAADIS
jgi:glycosyltransferase involved in cell wall biosynthesis